jgi:hypothetical protein
VLCDVLQPAQRFGRAGHITPSLSLLCYVNCTVKFRGSSHHRSMTAIGLQVWRFII